MARQLLNGEPPHWLKIWIFGNSRGAYVEIIFGRSQGEFWGSFRANSEITMTES